MQAIVIDQFGGIEEMHLRDMPIPSPKADEVQIKVAYAGVNPVDWKIREGWLKKRVDIVFPAILGWDVAGVVSAVGRNVTTYKEGDAVYSYCRKSVVQWGTFAEYVTVSATDIALKPTTLTFAQAAAIPLVGLTAWQALFDTANLQRGQTVLIHAGAGGVGSLAIQLAKNAGAKVYTTASHKNHTYVKKLGADVVIDYATEDFAEKINSFESGGVDVVIDTVGDTVFEKSLSLVKKEGFLVTITKMDIDQDLAKKLGIHMVFAFVHPSGKELQQMGALFDQGSLNAPEIIEYPLHEAANALEELRKGHTRGKIVLKVL